jgi:hypothetical protein
MRIDSVMDWGNGALMELGIGNMRIDSVMDWGNEALMELGIGGNED